MACRNLLVFTLAVFCNINSINAQVQDYSYRDHELLLKGDSLINNDQWDEAITSFSTAQKQFEQDGNLRAVIYAGGKIAFCYMQKDDYRTAFRYLSNAFSVSDKNPESANTEISTVYSHLGSYYYMRPNQSIDSSLFAYKKAVKICEEKLPEVNDDLAMAYAGMGWYHLKRDEYLESIHFYKKSFEIRTRILSPLDQRLGHTCQGLGIAYRGAGETYRSQDFLKRAIEIYESNDEFSPSFEYSNYNGLANTYFDLKEFEIAQPIYEKTLEIGAEINNPQKLIVPLNNLASTYAHTSRPDSSGILFRKALEINLDAKRISDYGLLTTYLQMGDFYLLYKDLDSARYCFEKSVQIVENMVSPSPISKASSYAWLARTESQAGNLQQALSLIQKAIISLEYSFEDLDIYANPELSKTFNNDFLYEYLEIKGDIFFLKFQQTGELKDLQESQKLYLLVDELTDDIRNGPYSDRAKLLVAKSFKHTASSAIRNSQMLYDMTNDHYYTSMAFNFMEKNRYAELYSNVAKLKSAKSEVSLDSVYNREQELIYEIDSRRRILSHEQEDSVISIVSKELFDFVIEFDQLQADLTSTLPTYQQINYDSLASLKDSENYLDWKTQILEYFIGDSLINIISIRRAGSELYSIPLNNDLKGRILMLQKLISNFDNGIDIRDQYQNYSQLSSEIYNILVGNYLDKNTEKIIISPDGVLAQLPFESFILNQNGMSYKNSEYLISKYDLQYIFSVNLTLKNPAPGLLNNPTFMAFAYSSEEAVTTLDSRNLMNEIPSTAKEVAAIKKVFGRNVKILTDTLATETSFKSLAINYDILHLAVHGVGDPLDANNSRLIFKVSSDTIDDGILYAHELYNIPFNNLRMAVLSACESGIGMEYPGEGIFSMARGFAYAGCPTTIMSLWKTSDASSARIMDSFYNYLEKGFSTSQSLRFAKLDYLKESRGVMAHPTYWAALVPMGDSKAIVDQKHTYLWYIVVFLIILFVITLWIRNKRILPYRFR